MASSGSSMLEVFEQLQTPQSKIKALDDLLDKLTHDQIRFLQAKISTVDFRSDPLKNLPFELCYQVFQHLEVYQIFQAQRVSRKWSQILSSPQIVQPLVLRPWLGNSDTSSRTPKSFLHGGLTKPDGLSPVGEASLQAGHVDSFRNGTAFSMAVGKWKPQVHGYRILFHIDFAGSILAWTDQQVGGIQLKCLISGEKVSLFTPTQEEVRQIAISETTIVAMTRSGKFCAWDLSVGIRNMEGQSPICLETDVVHVEVMVVSGSTVVILHDGSWDTETVTTWDIECRQSYQFRIEINQGILHDLYNNFAIVNPDEKSFVFFERIFDESDCVRFTRMNLKGQIESSGCMEHPNIDGYSMHSETTAPVCTTGCVTLWSYAARREELDAQQAKPNTWEVLRVCYNTKTDRLELQEYTVEHSIRTSLSRGDFLWWNDVAYLGNYENRAGELEVLDLKASVCKRAEMSASENLESRMDAEDYGRLRGEESFHANDSFLLGNESFLINVRPGYYIVWCFENIKLADEDTEYRAMMMEKKRQRLEEKRQREG